MPFNDPAQSGGTLATAYTSAAADDLITLTSGGGAVIIQDASTSIAADLFIVRANGGSGTKFFEVHPTAGLTSQLSDANTNTVLNLLTLNRATSGTAAANIGCGVLLKDQNGAGTMVNAVQVAGLLTTVTAGAEVSEFQIFTRNAGGALAQTFAVAANGIARIGANGFLTQAGSSDVPRVLMDATNGVQLVYSTITVKLQPNGAFNNGGGVIAKRTARGDANYTALVTDYIIGFNVALTAARTVTIPGASPAGTYYIIKSENAVNGVNTLAVTPGSGTIDGAASKTITTAFGAVIAYSDGTNYFTLDSLV